MSKSTLRCLRTWVWRGRPCSLCSISGFRARTCSCVSWTGCRTWRMPILTGADTAQTVTNLQVRSRYTGSMHKAICRCSLILAFVDWDTRNLRYKNTSPALCVCWNNMWCEASRQRWFCAGTALNKASPVRGGLSKASYLWTSCSHVRSR